MFLIVVCCVLRVLWCLLVNCMLCVICLFVAGSVLFFALLYELLFDV